MTAAPTPGATRALHAAFHEGAHFVAHRHLLPAEDPYEIAIWGDGRGQFAAGGGGDLAHARERVVAIYAGAAADLALDPEQAAEIRAQAAADDQDAAEWLERLGEAGRQAEYRRRARSLVSAHWREIVVIAAMLLEVGTLRGDVAKMILALVNGSETAEAARNLHLAPEAAQAGLLAFAFRLAPGHVADVLARHGYRASGSD